MTQPSARTALEQVAACTIDAAHRRDHQHAQSSECHPDAVGTECHPHAVGTECHPHAVEVVYLGDQAVMVCHDCCSDTGFLPHRDAEQAALAHRERTTDAPLQGVGRTAGSSHRHAA